MAADPASGDVGVAAASCVPVPIDAVAALVPGKGAAAIQADFSLRGRNRVYELLKEGVPAGAILTAVTEPAFDPRAPVRQYGIVTLAESLEVTGYTGAETFPWAGDRQEEMVAVSVQGNFLESEAVVVDALGAYMAGEGSLSDRLLQALVAGSAAGGDRRCNRAGVRQTAAAAFIMVARAGDDPFAVSALGVSEAGEADTPWLYLSVSEPIGGENAVTLLQQRYDRWQEQTAGTEANPVAQEATHERTPPLVPVVVATMIVLVVLLLVQLRAATQHGE